MDDRNFDSFTRSLAKSRSRRSLLRAVGGGLAGGLLGLAARGVTETASADVAAAPRRICIRILGLNFCLGPRPGPPPPCNGVPCADLCCPPETIGCTGGGPSNLPVGCLCPEGTVWNRATNTCDCLVDYIACGDSCCPDDDFFRCAGGRCCFAGAVCGDVCCDDPGSFCVDGACVHCGLPTPGICDDACCRLFLNGVCVGGQCCRAEQVCGDFCCPGNLICENGRCVDGSDSAPAGDDEPPPATPVA